MSLSELRDDLVLSAYYPQVIAGLAGISSGGILGAFITTKNEMIARGVQSQADPLVRVPSTTRVLIGSVATIILLASLVVLVALGILRMSGVDYLGGNLKAIFGLSFLVGAGIGKYGRYLYWRRA